jgi:tRNA (cmo5U34)-methyltransferase
MKTPLDRKSSTEEIRRRFDADVERFSNMETGQQATVDAPLAMELITRAALAVTHPIRSVLDIGCGAGNNTLKLLQFVNPLDCDLVDVSRPMLERARERVGAANKGRTTILQGDFRTLDLPAGRFDVIVAAAVLHHLRDERDWENAFRKIINYPRPKGRSIRREVGVDLIATSCGEFDP